MGAAQHSQSTWLLFCARQLLRKRARLSFICGPLHHEATVSVKSVGIYDLSFQGDLVGAPYSMEVESRWRLPGDLKDAARIQFVGRFEHEDGVSGDFTIREQANGELMTLGIYGTPQTIRVVKIKPHLVLCPLEVLGISGADICLETGTNSWHPPTIPAGDMPKRPGRRSYAGYCTVNGQDEKVPMASLLATLMLLYDFVLATHYMDPS